MGQGGLRLSHTFSLSLWVYKVPDEVDLVQDLFAKIDSMESHPNERKFVVTINNGHL